MSDEEDGLSDYCDNRECNFWEYGDVCGAINFPQFQCPEKNIDTNIKQKRLDL